MPSLTITPLVRSFIAWLLLSAVILKWWVGSWFVLSLWVGATVILVCISASRQAITLFLTAIVAFWIATVWPVPWPAGMPGFFRLGLSVGLWSLLIMVIFAGIMRYAQQKNW